jgi:hypothetical protein
MPVEPCHPDHAASLHGLLARYRLALVPVADAAPIPGTFWGAPEAGLIGSRVYARADTPVHSVLHEACHVVCMAPVRRARLHTDAGGDPAEESAVCYLSVVLAGELPGFGRARMLADMDAWGYTFRLGSARAWFSSDAEDARGWLIDAGILDRHARPTWAMRTT